MPILPNNSGRSENYNMAKGKASDWKWRVTDEVNQEIGDENGQDVTYSKSKLETRFSLEEKKKKNKKTNHVSQFCFGG